MSTDANDLTDFSRTSNCCGAAIKMGDLCARCGEHCDDAEEEGEKDNPAELRADAWRDWWKDEGRRERDEMIERLCKDAKD